VYLYLLIDQADPFLHGQLRQCGPGRGQLELSPVADASGLLVDRKQGDLVSQVSEEVHGRRLARSS